MLNRRRERWWHAKLCAAAVRPGLFALRQERCFSRRGEHRFGMEDLHRWRCGQVSARTVLRADRPCPEVPQSINGWDILRLIEDSAQLTRPPEHRSYWSASE